MDDDDDFSPDPELAAALGFSSFGAQPSSKRRKYNNNDAVVDIDAALGNGANSLPLGQRPPKSPSNDHISGHSPDNAVAVEKEENAAEAADGAAVRSVPIESNPAVKSILQDWDVSIQGLRTFTQPELQALREGVRLPGGGTITYFLPSFVENPWNEG